MMHQYTMTCAWAQRGSSYARLPQAGAECNATLAAFNKAVSELGPLIKAGSVDLTGEEAAAKGTAYGVDAAALSDCALDVALAPFDDKGDPAEWQRYTGARAPRRRHIAVVYAAHSKVRASFNNN